MSRNKIETKNEQEKKSVKKCWFFEKISKMINLQPDLCLKKEKKNERGGITPRRKISLK